MLMPRSLKEPFPERTFFFTLLFFIGGGGKSVATDTQYDV